MDAPIPLWRTGLHALATDHGCEAKATGESSLLCNAFVIMFQNQRFRTSRVGLSFGSHESPVDDPRATLYLFFPEGLKFFP